MDSALGSSSADETYRQRGKTAPTTRASLQPSTENHRSLQVRYSATVARGVLSLLLKDQWWSADSLAMEVDINFNAVGDRDEGNALIHSIVLAIKGHNALN